MVHLYLKIALDHRGASTLGSTTQISRRASAGCAKLLHCVAAHEFMHKPSWCRIMLPLVCADRICAITFVYKMLSAKAGALSTRQRKHVRQANACANCCANIRFSHPTIRRNVTPACWENGKLIVALKFWSKSCNFSQPLRERSIKQRKLRRRQRNLIISLLPRNLI